MNSQTPTVPPLLPGQNEQVNKTLALLRRQYPAAADQFISEVQAGRIAANEVAARLHQFVTALQRQPQAAQQASSQNSAAGQTSTPTPPAGTEARPAAGTPSGSPAPGARPLGQATTPQQQALARNIQSHGDALKRLQSMGSQLQAQCTTLQAKLNEFNENPSKAGPGEKAATETQLADTQKQWVQCKRKFDSHHQIFQQAKQQYLALTNRTTTPAATPSTSSPAPATAATPASAPTPTPAATTAAANNASTVGAVPSPRPTTLPTTAAGANLSLPARSGTPASASAASPPVTGSSGVTPAKPAVPAARPGSGVNSSGAGTPSLTGTGAGQSPAYLTSAPIPSTLQVTASQTTAAQPFPNPRGARPTLNQGLAGGAVLAAPPTLQRPNVLPSSATGGTSTAADQPASDWESLLGLPSGGKTSAGKVSLQDDVDASDDELALTSGPNAAANLRTHGRLVSKRRIQSLVGDLAPGENLEGEVEDLLLELADEFIESTTRLACRLAKHRRSDRLEVRDVQLHLERNWNLRVPFPGSNPIAPPRPRGPAAQGGQK